MPLDVLLLYNEPVLPPSDPDHACEAGVLESVAVVSDALISNGHRIQTLPVRSLLGLMTDLQQELAADVIFNLFEGFNGGGQGEALVAGIVETLGYPLTGCDATCLALALDKARTKWLLRGAGVPTPEFQVVGLTEDLPEAALRALLQQGPVIVKPAGEDASLGIGPESVVEDYDSLAVQIEAVRVRYGTVLVEQFVAGREFTAAILALGDLQLLPLSEIEFDPGRSATQRLVSYEAKWACGSADDLATVSRCPARVSVQLGKRIEEVALAAFSIVGCRDYARIDLRVDSHGQVWILEINANPDIGPRAGLVPALEKAGITYQEFLERLVQQASNRRPASIITPG